MNAVQANRRDGLQCRMHEISGCGECSGLADEIREAVDADQRTIVAIMNRKRASGNDGPVQNFNRPRTGSRGTEVARRWGWS